MALQTQSGLLPAKSPYEFEKTLTFMQGFTPMGGEQDILEDRIIKALTVNSRPIAFEVTDGSSASNKAVHYTLYAEEPISDSLHQLVARRIADMFSLDDDIGEFYSIAQNDETFAPIIERLYGYHHVKFPTFQEAGCWFMLSNHNRMNIARKAKRNLTERYGTNIELNGKTYWAFPELEQLASASPDELGSVIGNERRAEYLHNVIQALAKADEDYLRSATYEEAEAWLRRIKGVGEWSAAAILLRGLGRTERLPFNIEPILRAMHNLYGPGETMEQIARRYGRWIGYWALYLRTAE